MDLVFIEQIEEEIDKELFNGIQLFKIREIFFGQMNSQLLIRNNFLKVLTKQ